MQADHRQGQDCAGQSAKGMDTSREQQVTQRQNGAVSEVLGSGW